MPNSTTVTKIVLMSLSEYFDLIDNKYQKGSKTTARIMALALPLFELKACVFSICKTVLTIPTTIIKIPIVVIYVFSPPGSLAFEKTKKYALELSGPLDLIITALKSTFLFIAIFCAPFLGLLSPYHNRDIHEFYNIIPEIVPPRLPENISPRNCLNGFKDIAGMDDLKKQMNGIIEILKNPKLAKKHNIKLPNGLLMDGPPGCGKTFFAKKFVEEVEIQLKKSVFFYEIETGKDISSYIHRASENITAIFNKAEKQAKDSNSLAIIFIDEIDILIPKCSNNDSGADLMAAEEKGTFLKMLNNAGEKNIFVIGATNYLDKIDPTAIRPGRFDYKIHVPKPDGATKLDLLEKLFITTTLDVNVNLSYWLEKFRDSNISEIKLFSEMAIRSAFYQAISSEKGDMEGQNVIITHAMLKKAYADVYPNIAIIN